jgi:hypothetical protein
MEIQFVPHREQNPSQNAVMGKIGVRFETHTKLKKRATLCGKMHSLFMLTVGGKYSYHWALSG